MVGISVVVALPYILYQGRDQWFSIDEWDFLAARQLTSLSDLMRPHNGFSLESAVSKIGQ